MNRPVKMPVSLNDPALLEGRALIGGSWRWADSGATFPVRNPSTGEIIAEVADCGEAETRAAIDAAYEAQKSWAAMLAAERGALVMKLRDLMLAHQDDLGAILCAEMGKPLAEAKGEIAYGASFLEWFAEEGKRLYGDVIPTPVQGKRILTIRQPVGVVASITPWDFPNAMIARKIAPGLRRGLHRGRQAGRADAALRHRHGRARGARGLPGGRLLRGGLEPRARCRRGDVRQTQRFQS
jgi:NAD-dependent aldehyde dehydrogenases